MSTSKTLYAKLILSDDPLDDITPTSSGDGTIRIYDGTALLYHVPDADSVTVSDLLEQLDLSDEDQYGLGKDRTVALSVGLTGEMVVLEELDGDVLPQGGDSPQGELNFE